MFCTTCAQQLVPSAIACIKCGCPPRVGIAFCGNCGSSTMPQAVMCVRCGLSLSGRGPAGQSLATATPMGMMAVPLQNTPVFDKTALCLLCFLLGGIGAHKFYTRNWGWGIVYLVTAWTFIPALVALVELIRYLTLSPSDVQMKCLAASSNPFGWV